MRRILTLFGVVFVMLNLSLSLIRALDIIYELYASSKMAAFFSFYLILIILVVLFFLGVLLLYRTLTNKKWFVATGLISFPLAVLPFSLLGVSLPVLDNIFIFRSYILMLNTMICLKWFLGDFLRKDKLIVPCKSNIILLVLLYLLSLYIVDKAYVVGSVQAILVLLSCIVYYIFIVNYVDSKKTMNFIFIALIVACFIQTILASFSFIYYVVIQGRHTFRVEGVMRDYELFAEYLAIHIPILLYMKDLFKKYVFHISLIIVGVMLVLLSTGTRGALISLCAGILYYSANGMSKRNLERNIYSVVLLASSVVIGILLLKQFFPESSQIVERFINMDIATFDTRGPVWHRFYELFRKEPIFGYGIVYDLRAYLFWPHSAYFSYLLMSGLLGLLVYVGFLARVCFVGLQNVGLAKQFEPDYIGISVTLNTMLLIFIIDSLKIDFQRHSTYQIFIWTVFALILGWNLILKKKIGNKVNESIVCK